MATNVTAEPFDDHTLSHAGMTVGQLTLTLAGLTAVIIYLIRIPRRVFPVSSLPQPPDKEQLVETNDNNETKVDLNLKGENSTAKKTFPMPTFDEFISYSCQLFFILIMFWFSDYKKGLPAGERVYSKDVFLFLVFILFLVASAFTIHQTPDVILNREQTEEWKGWMQVMFVWYHYFHAHSWYNWIRVYIAAYVWMTGFGNFSFFWLKKDYSLWRCGKMLFRLNFYVLTLCATLSNSYMLYYICAMHTYWFLSVYAMMSVGRQLNSNPRVMAAKLAIYAAVNLAIFDVSGVAEWVFLPLAPVLGYTDPERSIMHEWVFRAGLDHWACFIGMLCAYNYPHYEAFIHSLEQKVSQGRQYYEHIVKAAMATAIVAILYAWYTSAMTLDKYDYNQQHPYTSTIPVVLFGVMRNLYPAMRVRYLFLFNWLGKITLETYLTQLHLYLQSNAKQLIVYIPDYPLLNFSLATIIYLVISHRVFMITSCFSAFLIPHDTLALKRNVSGVLSVMCAAFAAAYFIKNI